MKTYGYSSCLSEFVTHVRFFRAKNLIKELLECKCLAVHADAGEVPRDKVACVHAAEVGRFQVLCERAGVKVVHVLVDPDV